METTLKFAQDVAFLALVLWREARGEPTEGKIAVAHSIMNRVKRPAWWGDCVLAVVTKKWQYSSMTDPKDPQLVRWPLPGDPEWQDCMTIARGVYDGTITNPVPGADSYYADTMPAPPDWAVPAVFKQRTGRDLVFVKQIGHHRFYDTDHDYEPRPV